MRGPCEVGKSWRRCAAIAYVKYRQGFCDSVHFFIVFLFIGLVALQRPPQAQPAPLACRLGGLRGRGGAEPPRRRDDRQPNRRRRGGVVCASGRHEADEAGGKGGRRSSLRTGINKGYLLRENLYMVLCITLYYRVLRRYYTVNFTILETFSIFVCITLRGIPRSGVQGITKVNTLLVIELVI